MASSDLKQILLYNKIAPEGIEKFPSLLYEVDQGLLEPSAILLRSHRLGHEEIPKSVIAIARAGTGVNNIPVDWCTKNGIPVFNTPGANANAVKELVAAGLLLGARGIVEGAIFSATLSKIKDRAVLNKKLEENKLQFKGEELVGKTLGVVGLGAIGSLVAEMALTFGMNVIGYDPAISVEAAWRLSSKVKRSNKISSLFAKSDYVTLHLPAIDSTHHIINENLLSHCKKGVCLLNFSRSEIVDPMAIQSALESGVIGKYISDFPEPELLKRRDAIFLPHIGASTKEAEANCAIMAANQLRDFIETGSITNSVNYPNVNLEYVSGCRIAITNENVPKILGSVLSVFANENINVIDMLNKSRNSLAYNLIDLDRLPTPSSLDQIQRLEGISNVRIVY
ncbi:MAG: 3-phosphoglycerate dehydrogenase family protein [Halieaceae bacterium]|nr:3-phosphoglycerate dehydrogenase family protein [Halieaceae bacterium]